MTPRRPLLALAAALVMPGLGHVYLGDFVSGASLLLAIGLAVPVFARLALWAPASWLCYVMLLGVVIAIAAYACSAQHAFRRAKQAPNVALRSFQRPTVYALYVAVGYAFVLEPASAHARDHWLETFVVPSASMMPAILPGDRFFADKTVGQSGGAKLERGAVVVFVNPNDPRHTFVKRVIGLPGDRIQIAGSTVRVNGAELTRADSGEAKSVDPATTYLVPSGCVFVLGEQLAHAIDSRTFGPVPLANVKGIARQVWFSHGPNEGVRWSRIGHLLG